MEKEHLVPLLSTRNPPPLSPSQAQDNEEISLLTPLEIKHRLIFGPIIDPTSQSSSSSPYTPSLLEVIALASTPNPPPILKDQSKHIPIPISKKPNLHRCNTAPARAVINELNHPHEHEHESTTQPILKQALLLLLVYLSVGILIYWFNRDQFSGIETHPIVDAFYFCIVTMCTIGYGDITPNTPTTKWFSILFVLVGFGFIDIVLSGVVSYVLDLHENHLLRAVMDGKKTDNFVLIDVKKGRFRIRMKVALALGVVVGCIGVGMIVLHYVEALGWLDSLYLSVMSVTTVGYGDHTFTLLVGRIFACVWLLVSTLAVARAFLYLAEARVDKRNRKFVKEVLGEDMTVSQFLAADIDHNGCVSKSEYVIYKLKEMEKVSENDILLICHKFDQLDTRNCGKITLADLVGGDPKGE